jgi:hypothetical protein
LLWLLALSAAFTHPDAVYAFVGKRLVPHGIRHDLDGCRSNDIIVPADLGAR